MESRLKTVINRLSFALVGAGALMLVVCLTWPTDPEVVSIPASHSAVEVEPNAQGTIEAEAIPDLAEAAPPAPELAQPAVAQVTSQTTSISGSVIVEKSGQPAPGVLVGAYESWFSGDILQTSPVPSVQTRTDEQGRYVLSAILPEKRYTVTVDDTGQALVSEHVVVYVKLASPPDNVDIVLWPGCSVGGKVITGRYEYHPEVLKPISTLTETVVGDTLASFIRVAENPVPGFRVSLNDEKAPEAPLRETTTDSSGKYLFSGIPSGRYRIRLIDRPPSPCLVNSANADPDGSRGVYVSRDAPVRDDIDFLFAEDSLAITGRVVDTAGAPIAGAQVHARRFIASDEGPYEESKAERTAVSDDSGRYRLDGIPVAIAIEAVRYMCSSEPAKGGTCMVSATAPGYCAAEIVVPVMDENAVLAGKKLIDWSNALEGRESEPLTSRVTPLPTIHEQTISAIDFTLQREAVVAGRVQDRRGDPVPGVSVQIVPATSTVSHPEPFLVTGKLPGSAKVDDSAQFRIQSIPDGLYLFEVAGCGHSQTAKNDPLALRFGDIVDDLALIVETSGDRGNIRLAVLGEASEKPVLDCAAKILDVNATDPRSQCAGDTARWEKGVYLTGISPGEPIIEVQAKGMGRERLQVTVASGQTTDATVLLSAEGVVKGEVRVDGVPTWARIQLQRSSWKDNAWNRERICFRAETDRGGKYELSGLPPDSYFLCVHNVYDKATGAETYGKANVTVAAGQTTVQDFDLGGSCTIRGSLSFPETYSVGGIIVRDQGVAFTLPAITAPPFSEQLVAGTWKIGNGASYEIGGLPEGSYVVTAYCRPQDDYSVEVCPQVSRNVTVEAGTPAELDFVIEEQDRPAQ
jgi:protocatechuate 3,4-dioxygenase beta subunit